MRSIPTRFLNSSLCSLKRASRMLGHSQIETTQIYAKVTDEKIDADTKALNRKISERFSVVI